MTKLKPVVIGGIKYESRTLVCRLFKIDQNTLSKRYRRGLRGHKLVAPADKRHLPYPKPVRVGKKKYPSLTAAACALSLNLTTVSERHKRNIPLDAPLMPGRPKTRMSHKRRMRSMGCNESA